MTTLIINNLLALKPIEQYRYFIAVQSVLSSYERQDLYNKLDAAYHV
jgi:hypothetical protein